MKKMDQMELFNLINQVSFMLDDIALYLDTHPSCEDGIAAYNHYKEIREEAIADYTKMYGPICRYDVNTDNYFEWVNNPWPWEGVCGC